MQQQRTFPPGFLWGAATSSFQIEGAWNQDGKSESIWDHFVRQPGTIEDDSTGDVACDHYHRWPHDVALMQTLGLHAYRFSIAWPRILPEGTGRINQAGLDFYSRLVDGLLEAGIAPWVTLYHWDLPQVLQDAGGWPTRTIAEYYVEYVDAVTNHLGDRVKNWITHNEPFVVAFLGHLWGEHAPGSTDMRQAFCSAHHLLLSHGWAVPIIRRNSADAKVGITLNLYDVVPASPSTADTRAARREDGLINRLFLDPLYGRHYPSDMLAAYEDQVGAPPDCIKPGDLDVIAVQTDFLGVNYYTRSVVRDDEATDNLSRTVSTDESEFTEMGWEVHAPSLTRVLARLHFDYQVRAIYITENGAAYGDGPDENDRIADNRRVRYYAEHLAACHEAIQLGVPLNGYFAWSLMDNFEWAHGYTKRFGLVWVDFASQARLPKESAHWYRDVIAQNGLS